MSVYYKFNSELNYSYVDFDGLHIAVSDLKKAILHQKRLGKTADFDLLISNAQTKEEYKDEQCLIPKNTSLIVARIPLSNQSKKNWAIPAESAVERTPQNPSNDNINHDITRMNGSEDDKIQAMMMQSTLEYDPTNYQRVRGITQQMGDVPANYRCHKCQKPGHWIKNCPLNPLGKDHHHFKTRPESKKMTGIPRSLRDAITENQEPVQNQFVEEKREVPEDLICAICKGIFKDAVMIPCCGSSFCDECVRTALLESEDNECPDCKEKGTSPGSLIPNRFLRNAVAAFHAESSNVLNRESQKRIQEEEVAAPDEVEEESVVEETLVDEESAPLESEELAVFETEEDAPENEKVNKHSQADKDSESDDDDNITVTVPPAHQQSRGASFRDSRLRRIPSQPVGEFNESYPHSSTSKNHHDEGEPYDDESGDAYAHRHHSSSKRGNHYESSQPQGIATLGDDKVSSRDHYREHSSRPPQNMSSHDESYPSHLQHPPHFNQGQHPGMMPQMQPHSMYPQGPYHQPSGQYYQQNQIRRYDQQGNYPVPIRHHNAPQMMRPSMQESYGMRHPRPPINNLANTVTQNIQQRYGTGFIDDPLEAFNRIMREKELRKEQRYRRSPVHNNDRRSRSFERKRSPVHQYSPDNRRQKNYSKTRKRSRSFKSNSKSYSRSRSRERSMRGRTKSRSYSPRYRRKDNIQAKDRRDDRHRSPARRGNYQNNRSSRGNYKGDSLSKPSFRDGQENLHYHENTGNQHDKIAEYPKDLNSFEAPHSLDEQPPPPGDETEPILQTQKQRNDSERQDKVTGSEEVQNESSELNGSSKVESETRKDERHHHHKKSRAKNYETSSDDKKARDKKKRKKSREHEKKKSKKDRKSRPDKEKDKKSSSKTESVEKTPEAVPSTEISVQIEAPVDEKTIHRGISQEEAEVDDRHHTPEIEDERIKDTPLKPSGEKQSFRRSDSILDINPNVDLDLDEWAAPEVSKWERDENKSLLDTSEGELGNGDVKKNPEERVTSEIIKRAENAIFARAISAIRPIENKKMKTDLDVHGSKKESSPMTSLLKRSDSSKDSKLQSFQVSIPANDSGTRSIELKTTESTRDASKQRKSPLRTSIKNRLGVKIIEKKSRSKTPSPLRSPKRRLQSDSTKASGSSKDRGGRIHAVSTRERPSSPDRRNKQLSSCIRVESRDQSGGSRSRVTDRRRSRTPDDRRAIKRPRASRSRSKSRHDARRHDQRSNTDKSYARPKEPPRNDDKSSRPVEQPSLSDLEKSKAKGAEASIKKRSRDLSSSSSSSTASSSGSQKHSKRHSKHKVKKKSRSISAESNGIAKRKKSKKEKKAKKKKKSRK